MFIPSKYNFEFAFDGRCFIYNILTTALVELTDDVIGKAMTDQCSDTCRSLVDSGFLVAEGTDERKQFEYYFDTMRFGVASRTLKVFLLPTYGCNLGCPYCYQGQGKTMEKMGVIGAQRALRFLGRTVTAGKNTDTISKIAISLYGGEPMMDKPALKTFCAGASSTAQKYELPIAFNMTTNLTLLDSDTIALINNYNIELQVTIDGIKPIHDKRRIFKNGSGTYDIIIKHLKELAQKGLSRLITLRINVDNESIVNAEETFQEVRQYANNIYFSVIVPYNGMNDCHKSLCVPEKKHTSFILKTNDILARNGGHVYRQFGKRMPCSLVTPNRFFIDSRFDVYGCDSLVNHPECRIGTIDEEGNLLLSSQYYDQITLSATRTEKCMNCKLLPACGGGCPATSYINSGKKNARLECQCILDDHSLKEYLIDYIKRLSTVES